MIYVDDRAGSKELQPLFPPGSATLTHLEYGDFMFTGHYDDGDIVIGVERKRIGDFINSMCTGRLAGHQLIGMQNSYHYTYLIVEGEFRANPKNGLLETNTWSGWYSYKAGKRQFMARDIWAFMNTLEVVCGVHCYHCTYPTDTVYYLMALHHWWRKEYAEHKGHLQPHTGGDRVQLIKPSLVRRVASQFDGIGWDRAKGIDKQFSTVSEFVAADFSELIEIDGIGKGLASSIVEQRGGGK